PGEAIGRVLETLPQGSQTCEVWDDRRIRARSARRVEASGGGCRSCPALCAGRVHTENTATARTDTKSLESAARCASAASQRRRPDQYVSRFVEVSEELVEARAGADPWTPKRHSGQACQVEANV